MRKVLLVLTLVAASFAGGAVVNGPGLAWARKMVLGQGGASGYVALRGDDLVKSDGDPAKSSAEPPSEVPASPLPPLDELPTSPPKPPVDAPSPPDSPEPTPPIASKSEPAEKKAEPAEKAGIPWPPETPPSDSPKSEGPTLLAPIPGRSDPAVSNASLARETPPDSPESSTTWAELRKKMKEMGVARYWVEGEPGGPARFRCLIPVAGARAVAQHFEAEGDDDLQAADAALRRVALWRATEP